jgi:hypothetical protein
VAVVAAASVGWLRALAEVLAVVLALPVLEPTLRVARERQGRATLGVLLLLRQRLLVAQAVVVRERSGQMRTAT